MRDSQRFGVTALLLGLAIVATATFSVSRVSAQHDTNAGLVEEAALYMETIERVEPTPRPDVRRHLAQLSLVLPPAVLDEIVETAEPRWDERAVLTPTAGEELGRWWRSQDPMPASEANERLHEHLQRVRYAESHFASENTITGFDERGDVWVRYGAPSRRSVIRFDAPEFIDEVYRSGVAISPTDFPENEFWRYSHVHRDAYFLFVRDGGAYRQGTTTDLLPQVLQYGFNAGLRGQRKTDMALIALQNVLRQLALEHPDFASRFHDVDMFLAENRSTGRLRDRSLSEIRVGIVRGEAPVVLEGAEDWARSAAHDLPAHEFVQHAFSESKIRDDRAAWRRQADIPRTHTEVFRTLRTLPVAVRMARFLDADLTTRTEIYWSPEPGGLGSAVHPLIQMYAIRRAADYSARDGSSWSYVVANLPDAADATISARTTVLYGDTTTVHLAMQWDLHEATIGADGKVSVGQRIGIATAFRDSIEALRSGILEMSDLKPVVVRGTDDAEGDPYPFAALWPTLALGLNFEIYGLTLDRDGETRYTIRYGLEGERNPVTAEFTSSGERTTTQEGVLLDTRDWTGVGPVTVRVTVIDDVAGRSVTRSLPFVMVR